MPKPTTDASSSWRKLFKAADVFRDGEPWNVLDGDRELFAVVDSATGKTFYCCVIGSGGEVFGLIAYRGEAGYSIHYKMHHSELPPELNPDLGLEQDCLMAEFVYRNELSASDKRIIKVLGLKYRGFGYPRFRNFVPSLYPEELNEAEAETLTDCLEVGAIVCDFVLADKKYLRKKGHIRTWSRSSEGTWLDAWVKAPVVENVIPDTNSNELRIASLKKLNLKPAGAWEAGVVAFPGRVPTGDGRFFIPRLCVVADHESGFVFSHRLLDPSADVSLSLLNALLDAIKSSGYLPKEILVQEEATARFLLPTLTELNIEIYEQPLLPAIFNMRQEMGAHFNAER